MTVSEPMLIDSGVGDPSQAASEFQRLASNSRAGVSRTMFSEKETTSAAEGAKSSFIDTANS